MRSSSHEPGVDLLREVDDRRRLAPRQPDAAQLLHRQREHRLGRGRTVEQRVEPAVDRGRGPARELLVADRSARARRSACVAGRARFRSGTPCAFSARAQHRVALRERASRLPRPSADRRHRCSLPDALSSAAVDEHRVGVDREPHRSPPTAGASRSATRTCNGAPPASTVSSARSPPNTRARPAPAIGPAGVDPHRVGPQHDAAPRPRSPAGDRQRPPRRDQRRSGRTRRRPPGRSRGTRPSTRRPGAATRRRAHRPARRCPARITTTRSASANASSWSCVTYSAGSCVRSSSARISRSEPLAPRPVERAERLVEHEQARLDGERARERDPLLLAARQPRDPTVAQARRARRGRAPRRRARLRSSRSTPAIRSPNSTLPATSRCGNSAYSWNIRPNRRRCGGTPARSAPSHAIRPAVERLRGPRPRAAASSCRSRSARGSRRSRPPPTVEVDAVDRPRSRRTAPPRRSTVSIRARRARGPARTRSRARPAPVTNISTVDIAIACPMFSAPGRDRNREIAIGIVGASGRATNDVAPNSPSDTAIANPNADRERLQRDRQVDLAPHPPRRRAEHARRVAQPRVDRPQRGHDGADHERDRDHGLRERHEDRLGAQVDGPAVERDEEAEADRHRRRAERQHQQRVHRARRPARAATRSSPTPARRSPRRSRPRPARTRASSAAPPTRARTACRSRRLDPSARYDASDQLPADAQRLRSRAPAAARRGTPTVAPSTRADRRPAPGRAAAARRRAPRRAAA